MNEVFVEKLFDEFASATARGERPDVRSFLARAGKQADELGVLIDRYLQTVPAQPPDEETVVLMQARIDHVQPLVAARVRRGLRLRELADRLCDALGLGVALGDRVEEAYSGLERGQLDAGRVDQRVWEALGELLELDVRRLVGGSAPPRAAPAYFRSVTARKAAAIAAAPAERAAREPDEVDRLFGTQA